MKFKTKVFIGLLIISFLIVGFYYFTDRNCVEISHDIPKCMHTCNYAGMYFEFCDDFCDDFEVNFTNFEGDE